MLSLKKVILIYSLLSVNYTAFYLNDKCYILRQYLNGKSWTRELGPPISLNY